MSATDDSAVTLVELFIDGESADILKWVYNQGNTRELWLSPGEHTFRATLERKPDRSATVRLSAPRESSGRNP